MKAPAIWKLSMGHDDFKDILDVLDWLRRGKVVAHAYTKRKGIAHISQGENFVHRDRDGEFFYLCHGNRRQDKPRRGIILLGQFIGPSKRVTHLGDPDYAARRFKWIKTAVSSKKLPREHGQQWTPRNNSTFSLVPKEDLDDFEAIILEPYFEKSLSDL